MGLKHNNTDANDNTDSQYTSPYANTNIKNKDNNSTKQEKNKNIYNNLTPFSTNYYETPDQRSSLLKGDSHSIIPHPEYSTVDNIDGAYVRMDESNHDTLNQKGVYVPMDSI